MEKNQKKYYLDKDYIITITVMKYRTVSAFLREYGISRTRFYEILNAGYVGKEAAAVEALRKKLEIKKELLWLKK